MTIRANAPDKYTQINLGADKFLYTRSFDRESNTIDPAQRSANDPKQDAADGSLEVRKQLKQSARDQYDVYYKSGLYDERYPRPNLATLEVALSITPPEASVLDFGCGSGRYTIPVAPYCRKIVAYDPSMEAINSLAVRAKAHLNVVPTSQQDDIARHAPYDVALTLFGVISHIPERRDRLATLEFLRDVLSDDGVLVVSVPNRFRRFLSEQFKSALLRNDMSGQIFYHRPGIEAAIPYFLYTASGLSNDLRESGFYLRSIRAESLLPESLVTNWPRISELEHKHAPWFPASVGYGLLAVARRGQAQMTRLRNSAI